MAKRRGFIAEVQRAAAKAERDRKRKEASAKRNHAAYVREAARAEAAAARAQQASLRSDARAQAAAEREAKQLHQQARLREAELMTQICQDLDEEFAGILHATLTRDDYVDLESLKREVEHPSFTTNYGRPTPQRAPVSAPPEPIFQPPPEPTGVKAILGGKRRHAERVARAQAAFQAEHDEWRQKVAAVPMRQLAQMQEYQKAERYRLEKLQADQAAYARECAEREREVQEHNDDLDQLISALKQSEPWAVEEYVHIVLGGSLYPEDCEVQSELTFHKEAGELEVVLSLPQASELFDFKGYKYVKASDQIVGIPLTARDMKERYGGFVYQVVLRTMHEVWESDRDHHIKTISLTAGVHHISPSTGKDVFTPLVAVAADRQKFEDLRLENVTPLESLKYLKAVVSKDPVNLVAIPSSGGVRG